MKERSRLLRISLYVLIMTLLLIGVTTPAYAADFLSGEEVIIAAEETIDDDVLATGTRVIVDGVVTGDLLVAASEVIINGRVEGSLAVGAAAVTINGQVDGSVYTGVSSLTVDNGAAIGRNLYFGGLSFIAEPESIIGRSLYANGYQVIAGGTVANDVVVDVAALELRGTVGGDVTGRVSQTDQAVMPPYMPGVPGPTITFVEPGLRIGDDAAVSGDMTVTETIVETSARRPLFGPFAVSGIWWAASRRIGEFIALLVIGALLIRYWPALLRRTTAILEDRPLPSLGYGFLITVLSPFVAVAAFVLLWLLAFVGGFISFGRLAGTVLSVGSASFGLAAALFTFAFFMLTKIFVTLLGGRFILERIRPGMEASQLTTFWYLLLGAFLYEIVRAIPLLGWLVAVFVNLIGLGALLLAWREREVAALPVEPKLTPAAA
jgi:hypothetical protein